MPKYIDKVISNAEQKILVLALTSRLLVLLLMVTADTVFSDLDSSAHLQNFPCGSLDKTTPISTSNSWIARFLDGLAPWDSVYFVRIAKCGYETDMINAFFPFLPFLMRYGAKYTGLMYIGTELMNLPIESIYTALGLEVNIVAFCIAAVALHRLSRYVLQNEELASLSVLLFCCNPASVFYSAAYTESLFAACTWTGLVLLTIKNGGGTGGGSVIYWAAGVLLFCLAGATRSNGILSAWFLVHPLIIDVVNSIRRRKKASFPWKMLFKTIVGCAVVWSPYFAMQVYGYQTYCINASSGSSSGGNLQLPVWCFKRLPSLYGYVQKAYWDVGFLRFYRHLNRWPWLLQSAPVFYIAIVSCWMWMSTDWRRALSLGAITLSKRKVHTRSMSATTTTAAETTSFSFLNDAVAPYIYHLAGMTAIALFMMHVNVATRFLSSSPALYWGAAVLLRRTREDTRHNHRVISCVSSNWIWLWTMVSAILGCLLFPNFFPWT